MRWRRFAVLLPVLLAGAGLTATVAASLRGRPAAPAARTPDGTGVVTGSGSVPTRGEPLAISGRVAGLAPGTPVTMSLAVRNPNPFPVRVRTVTTTVGPPDRAPCPARLLDVGAYGGPPVAAPALSTVTVTVPVVLLDSLAEDQSGCPGATFPLTFGGVADAGR